MPSDDFVVEFHRVVLVPHHNRGIAGEAYVRQHDKWRQRELEQMIHIVPAFVALADAVNHLGQLIR